MKNFRINKSDRGNATIKNTIKNINNATVWDELIQLENKYSVTNDPLPPDYPLFKKNYSLLNAELITFYIYNNL